jgi:hypothetical protein
MDTNVLGLGVVAVFGVVAITGMVLFRQRARIGIGGPLGVKLDIDTANREPPSGPAVQIEDARSHKGSITGTDDTGQGVKLKNVEAERDIVATSRQAGADRDPKAGGA